MILADSKRVQAEIRKLITEVFNGAKDPDAALRKVRVLAEPYRLSKAEKARLIAELQALLDRIEKLEKESGVDVQWTKKFQ